MQFEGPIEDRLAIRELYGVYADATMRQDREAYLSCWTEDGVRIAPDGEAHGKAAIAAHWDGVWGPIRQMGFFTEIGAIIVTGDTATGRTHCREIVVFQDGSVWKVLGRYEDELVRRDGRWLLARHEYRLLHNERG